MLLAISVFSSSMADQAKGDKKQFEKTIQQFQNSSINPETQDMLNKPWSDSNTALSTEDKALVEELMKKIHSGDIKLHTPSSIINQTVYDQLSGENKAKTEIWISATIALIRQIHDFYLNPYDNNSDMMISMVQELRYKKEVLEKEIGDVLKI